MSLPQISLQMLAGVSQETELSGLELPELADSEAFFTQLQQLLESLDAASSPLQIQQHGPSLVDSELVGGGQNLPPSGNRLPDIQPLALMRESLAKIQDAPLQKPLVDNKVSSSPDMLLQTLVSSLTPTEGSDLPIQQMPPVEQMPKTEGIKSSIPKESSLLESFTLNTQQNSVSKTEISSFVTQVFEKYVSKSVSDTPVLGMTESNITPNMPLLSPRAGSIIQATSLSAAVEVSMPVQQTSWPQEVGERMLWMANKQIQAADIHLNPPELGPLKIQMSIQGDKVDVSFMSHSAIVRDTVEAALPRLREMFDQGGISIASAGVTHQNLSQHTSQEQTPEQSSDASEREEVIGFKENMDNAESDESHDKVRGPLIEGLVDAYV